MLGQGAMGITYKAFDRNLRTTCVLKVIRPVYAANAHFRERFLQEARTMAGVRHPGIAHVYFLGEAAGTVFYAMEFCDGPSLQGHVHACGPMPGAEACALVRQAAGALAALEANGIVHRDIKPGNLILTRDAQGRAQGRLIDFGLAVSTGGGDAAMNLPRAEYADFSGTPAYASPEHLEGAEPLSIASDVYALGATWWFLLTGHPPFSGSLPEIRAKHLTSHPPWSLVEGQPAPVKELLRLMLAQQAGDRPSPTQLCRDLDEILLRADELFRADDFGGGRQARPEDGDAHPADAPTVSASASTVNTQLAPTLLAPSWRENSSEGEGTQLAPTLLAPPSSLPGGDRTPGAKRPGESELVRGSREELLLSEVPAEPGAGPARPRGGRWRLAAGLAAGALVLASFAAWLYPWAGRGGKPAPVRPDNAPPVSGLASEVKAVPVLPPASVPAPAPAYEPGALGDLQHWLDTARQLRPEQLPATQEKCDQALSALRITLGLVPVAAAESVIQEFITFLRQLRNPPLASRLAQGLPPVLERLPAESFSRLEPDLAQFAEALQGLQLWLAMAKRRPPPAARRHYLERAAALGDSSADAILARFDLQDILEAGQNDAEPVAAEVRAKAEQSLAKIRALSDQGNAEARLILAKLCFMGRLLPEDDARALELATSAAYAGSGEALLWQGIIAAHLAGKEKAAPARAARWKEAVEALRRLDKEQQPAGYYHLYQALDGLRRQGPPERNEFALLGEMRDVLFAGAERWEPHCLYLLGLAYDEGLLPAKAKDSARAALFLSAAALCGQAPAVQRVRERAGGWLGEAIFNLGAR